MPQVDACISTTALVMVGHKWEGGADDKNLSASIVVRNNGSQ